MTPTRHGPRWTEYVDLDEVLRAPRNPKSHNAEVIAASMSRFGIVELPALDERTGRLVAGHGRLSDWQHRRDAGEDPPEGVQVDAEGRWLVPVNRGWSSRSDADAEAYLIVSNRSTELGGWDDAALAEMLGDLQEVDLLDFTGYTDADLERLARKQIDTEPGVPADPESIEEHYQCPACGHRFPASAGRLEEAPAVADGETLREAADDGSGFGPLAQPRR
jgi:hypothetical protein